MGKERDFIDKIAPLIVAQCKERGYKFASPIIAQAVLESASGTSGLAKYHNYFGLKCGQFWRGASVNMQTKEEYSPGVMTSIRDNFRAYKSMEEGVKGYFDFIASKRYDNLKTVTSPREYLELIHKDGYATAYSYVNSVYSVINFYRLEEYDDFKIKSKKPASRNEKSIPDLAREVIQGKWGNGEERKKRLRAAGYNFVAVQLEVNRILRG